MKHVPIIPGATIGILGAGQLGKMSLQAAHSLGYHTAVYAPAGDIPAMEMATHRLVYPWGDQAGISELIRVSDVITTEWENVPLALVKELERRGATVRPGSGVLEVAQSRIKEKQIAWALDIPTAQTVHLPQNQTRLADWGWPLPGILKTDALGYDGKGQWRVSTEAELWAAYTAAGVDCVLEKLIPLRTELSILAARTSDGRISMSDVVENTHQGGILDTTVFPPRNSPAGALARIEVQSMAERIAEQLQLEGLLAMEFFVDEDGRVLFNEMAPRPHNSFHGSIEAAKTSQFEQHVRAICGLPLGDVSFHSPFEMRNLIGGSWEENWAPVLEDPSSRLHLYGKAESRPGRKMGHVTKLLL